MSDSTLQLVELRIRVGETSVITTVMAASQFTTVMPPKVSSAAIVEPDSC